MAGGIRESDPAKLADYCDRFAEGTKRLHEGKEGDDMWYFELYWHLRDCADALRAQKT